MSDREQKRKALEAAVVAHAEAQARHRALSLRSAAAWNEMNSLAIAYHKAMVDYSESLKGD